MGTPEFAVPTLIRLHEEYGVCCVVTVPDKPAGRGRKLQESNIKIEAHKLNIPVLQPDKLKDEEFIDSIKNFNPDIIVVLAFRILPREVYTLAKLACFNIHGSLLPKYRGAAPIQWAIISGEKETGLTTFLLEDKVDTGNILKKIIIPISKNMTAGELHDSMMTPAADIAISTIQMILSGNYSTLQQDDALSCPAPKLFGDKCKIDWSDNSNKIVNFINGTSPYPGAWTYWNGERTKILRASTTITSNKILGALKQNEFIFDNNKIFVKTGDGIIEIIELQLPGRRCHTVADFIVGYRGEKRGFFN